MVIKIIPHHSGKIRQIKIPLPLFILLIIFLSAMIATPIIGFKIQFVRKSPQKVIEDLKIKREKLQNLKVKLDSLKEKTEALFSLAKKVRKSFYTNYKEKKEVFTMDINKMYQDVRLSSFLLSHIEDIISKDKKLSETVPSILPVDGWIIKTYGYQRDIFTDQTRISTGIDIACKEGAAVIATASGEVEFAGYKRFFGKTIVIDHGNGFKTKYSHLKEIIVKKGDKVKRGQIIGYVGKTGLTVGPVLHYEILYDGVPKNPLDYVLEEPKFF